MYVACEWNMAIEEGNEIVVYQCCIVVQYCRWCLYVVVWYCRWCLVCCCALYCVTTPTNAVSRPQTSAFQHPRLSTRSWPTFTVHSLAISSASCTCWLWIIVADLIYLLEICNYLLDERGEERESLEQRAEGWCEIVVAENWWQMTKKEKCWKMH